MVNSFKIFSIIWKTKEGTLWRILWKNISESNNSWDLDERDFV